MIIYCLSLLISSNAMGADVQRTPDPEVSAHSRSPQAVGERQGQDSAAALFGVCAVPCILRKGAGGRRWPPCQPLSRQAEEPL